MLQMYNSATSVSVFTDISDYESRKYKLNNNFTKIKLFCDYWYAVFNYKFRVPR